MKIGDKILTELDKQGKSKKVLAEYIGVKPASISDWSDSDNLRFWNVVKASEFLNVSLNYLAYGKEPSIPREYHKNFPLQQTFSIFQSRYKTVKVLVLTEHFCKAVNVLD